MNWGVLILLILTAAFSVVLFLSGGPIIQPGLLVAIAILAAVDLLLYMVELSQRKRLVRLAEAFDEGGAEVVGGMLSPRRVEGHFQGREVTLKSRPHGKGTPSRTIIQLACSSPLHFEFRRASPFRLVRFRNSFQLGDAEIDRGFSFFSQDADRVLSWLRQPENKDLVLTMLCRGLVGTSLESKLGALTWDIHGIYKLQDAPDPILPAESRSPGVHIGLVGVRSSGLKASLDRDIMRQALESMTQIAVALEKRA